MNVTYFRDYESMSLHASTIIFSEIEKEKNLLLCSATGDSPAGLYNRMVYKSKSQREFFDQMRVIKLDEWNGVSENHQSTCEYYLRTTLLDPLEISSRRYISFVSDSADPAEECYRIQSELDQKGPIDICILGLGKNGHIGLNEPGSFLEPHCHVADLSAESRQHNMVKSMKNRPKSGLTLGMQDILSARKILLLISGQNKESITKRLLQRRVSTDLPASFLWLHNSVECLIDQNVFLKASDS